MIAHGRIVERRALRPVCPWGMRVERVDGRRRGRVRLSGVHGTGSAHRDDLPRVERRLRLAVRAPILVERARDRPVRVRVHVHVVRHRDGGHRGRGRHRA